jgi:1,4-alpha-glucan branching enzyme
MGSTPYANANGTGVTFRVWAPNATSVAVPGSFNGWNTTANFLVEEGGSGIWSGDIAAARPGNEYKYHINGSVWKRDPRGRRVVHSADNTIVYDPKAFDWMGDVRLNVNAADLVIYEMHVGVFYDPTPSSGGPGKFTDAIAKLDNLIELGINAVELLPIMEFPGSYSWGYNLSDPYAVENIGYGGPDGLKSFVKAAHQRGIQVLLDVVHNHYGPNELDLWGFDNGSTPGIYFYSAAGICCTPWGNRPNYSSEGVRSFIIDSFRMWMDECHVDGFRWDAVGAMRHYDPGYVSIPAADSLIQYINSTVIYAEHPGVISIAEDDAFGVGFDGEWNHSFANTLINETVKTSDGSRDMTALFNAMNGSGFFRVLFSESHDLVGALNGSANQRLPTRIQPANPESYFARKRSMLAAAIVLSAPGIPMLFMGQELLETKQFADDSPLDWSRKTNYAGIVQFYRDMIHVRRNLDGVSRGMTGPNMTWHAVDNSAKLLAFHRWGAGPDDHVMMVLNFSNSEIANYQINSFPANGTWYVNLNSDWPAYSSDFGNKGSSLVQVSNGSGQITVGPYSVLVLSRRALPYLDSDGDGLLNGWEEQHFGDPISGVATADDDLDGVDNLAEQAADTDPHSADSVLKITDIRVENGNVVLSWKGGQSVRQILKRAGQLTGTWTALYTNQPPTAISNSVTIPGPISSSTFFRIETGR